MRIFWAFNDTWQSLKHGRGWSTAIIRNTSSTTFSSFSYAVANLHDIRKSGFFPNYPTTAYSGNYSSVGKNTHHSKAHWHENLQNEIHHIKVRSKVCNADPRGGNHKKQARQQAPVKAIPGHLLISTPFCLNISAVHVNDVHWETKYYTLMTISAVAPGNIGKK